MKHEISPPYSGTNKSYAHEGNYGIDFIKPFDWAEWLKPVIPTT
jgi:hypothetical protein